MSSFTLHTAETAPEDARPLIEKSRSAFGMLPNLHAVMAESPQHLEAYQNLHALFQETSLGVVERNVVWLSINVEHGCHYCVPAHTGIAKSQGVSDGLIDALREGRALTDPRLEALRQFTLKLVRERGRVSESDVNLFLAAGFTHRHILDIVLGVAQKVMSNYVNHLADTPVDAPFAKFVWTPSAEAAE